MFRKYFSTIETISLSEMKDSKHIPESLIIGRENDLSVYYAPFEYINTSARVILVGITPGFTQAKNAIAEAQRQIKAGSSADVTLLAAKRTGAFSGDLRPNLIAMLDLIGLHNLLNIKSCSDLFGESAHLVHTTSILRYPVFVDGKNYNGTPKLTRSPLLTKMLVENFVEEMHALPKAIIVPLGTTVSETMTWLVSNRFLDDRRILQGLPHPSGQNVERIEYFLGKRHKDILSNKTNPDKLDAAKASLLAKLENF